MANFHRNVHGSGKVDCTQKDSKHYRRNGFSFNKPVSDNDNFFISCFFKFELRSINLYNQF